MPLVIGSHPTVLYRPTRALGRSSLNAPRRPGGRLGRDVTCELLDYQVLALEQAPVPAGAQLKLSVPLVLVSVKCAVSVGDSATIV